MAQADRPSAGAPVRLDIAALLAAAEAAPPVGAVEAVGSALAAAIGATQVSFLIADYSGDSLIRLGHSDRGSSTHLESRETAERVRLKGSPHGRALIAQSVEVIRDGSETLLLAPV